MVVDRNKRASLNYIKERVWNKLQGWKEQLLSQVGREVLLKVVVQAIPTFAMSCFKLPVGLCHDIEMLIRKFWWGQQGEQRKFIGEVGRSCVDQRSLEVWVLKAWSNLMRPCLQNRCGGYYMIKILYFIRCLKPKFSIKFCHGVWLLKKKKLFLKFKFTFR